MKVCLASLRRVVVSGLILAITIIPMPLAVAQSDDRVIADVEIEGFNPMPESPMAKAQREGTSLPLTLAEATKLALENNLTIAIQNINEQNVRLNLSNAYAPYDMTLSINPVSVSSRVSYAQNWQGDGDLIQTTANTQNLSGASLSKRFSWGGNASVGLSGLSRSTTSTRPGSQYGSNFQVSYSQPLLRGLRIDQQRNQIRIQNLAIETDEIQFKNQVTTVIAQVQQQYWALVLAIRQYEIQRNTVNMARMNLRDNRRRLEQGVIANIAVLQGEANVARAEVTLFSQENSILQAQNSLRQTMSGDRTSEIWKRFIVPTDLPDFVEYKIDLETAIATALRNRSEIETARHNLKRNEWEQEMNRENKKWQVNLNSSYGRSGNSITIDQGPTSTVPVGGFFTSLRSIFFSDNDKNYKPGYNWQIQFTITAPVWQRSTDIAIAQNDIQRRNQLMSLQQTEQNIQVEITNAVQSLESNRLQFGTAEKSRELSQQQYENEQKRYDVGLTQNNVLLDALNAVAQAEVSELQALIQYRQAIVTLQRAMNTLLEENQFTTARRNIVNVPNLR